MAIGDGGFIGGIKSLSQINEGLKKLNDSLEAIVKNLNLVEGKASSIASEVNKVTSKGGQRNNGNAGRSQMPDSLANVEANPARMPAAGNMATSSASRRALMMQYGGQQVAQGLAQTVLGVGAGMYSMLPSTATVATNSLGYYQATVGTGVNPMRVQRQTFSDLGGGFSSTGSGSAAAAILSNRYMMPGTAQFRQSMKEVGGAYRYLGMDNETAAAAIAGIHTGSMSANLYQMGIQTIDPRTGKARNTGQIATDLYNRMFQGKKVSVDQVMSSLQYGYAGANLRNMGLDESQQELFSEMFKLIAQGKNPDLAEQEFGNKALKANALVATSESELIMNKQKAYLDGMVQGAKVVRTFNKALENVPDALYQFKAGLDVFGGSQAGGGALAALSAAFSGLATAIGGILMMMGVRAGAGAIAGATPAVVGGAGGVLKNVAKGGGFAAGGFAAGLATDALKSNFYDKDSLLDKAGLLAARAGQGALYGAAIGSVIPVIGTATGAVVGTIGGLLYGAMNGEGGDGETGSMKANPGGSSSSSPLLPVGNARVSSPFGPRQVAALGHTKPTPHKGTDYAVKVGTPVRVVKNGKVTRIEKNTRGYEGYHVLVYHGGPWSTLYAHLSKVNVRVGQTVSKGAVLGLSGTAGTGPHLHFEVRKNGVQVNPAEFMSGANSGDSNTFKVTKRTASGVETTEVINKGSATSNSSMLVTLGISGAKGVNQPFSSIYGKQSATRDFSMGTLGMSSESSGYSNEIADAKDSYSYEGSRHATSHRKWGKGESMPKNQLLSLLYNVGFRNVYDLQQAYAVAMTESNGRPMAHNPNRKTGDDSYGLFQINMIDQLGQDRLKKFKFMGLKQKTDLFDPHLNARIASWMSKKGRDWSSWHRDFSVYRDRYDSFVLSPDELKDTMANMGYTLGKGGKGTGLGGDAVESPMPSMSGGTGGFSKGFSSVSISKGGTVVNHAGNTVNITVQVANASDKEAQEFARKVKQIIENDNVVSALGSQ